MSDYYDTLGVPKDASGEEIKKAFRRQSKQAHPDRQGGDARAMVAINRAYQVLKDPEKRSYYDAHGNEPPISEPEQNARTMLFTAVMGVLGAEQEVPDLVIATTLCLAQIRHQENKEIARVKKIKARIERHRKRLRKKQGKSDIELLFTDQVRAIDEALEKGARKLQAISGAEKLIADYTYDPDLSAFQNASLSALLGGFRR